MSVKFLMHPVEKKVGDAVEVVQTEFIEVTFPPPAPGSVADVMFRPATDEDREKYAAAYREFKPSAKAVAPVPSAKEPPPEFMPGFAEPAEEVKPSHHVKPHKKG
jgi:hypothetical protein